MAVMVAMPMVTHVMLTMVVVAMMTTTHTHKVVAAVVMTTTTHTHNIGVVKMTQMWQQGGNGHDDITRNKRCKWP